MDCPSKQCWQDAKLWLGDIVVGQVGEAAEDDDDGDGGGAFCASSHPVLSLSTQRRFFWVIALM